MTIFTTGQPYFNVMILTINHICKQNLSYVAPVSFFLLWQPCLDYDIEIWHSLVHWETALSSVADVVDAVKGDQLPDRVI